MAAINAIIQQDHFTTRLVAANHEIIADEPLALGGQDKGCTPSELLAASLAACTAITLRMYADRKQWDVQEIDINVVIEKSADGKSTQINRVIHLSGNLDEIQRNRLLDIANHCPIHKILTNPINIQTTTT